MPATIAPFSSGETNAQNGRYGTQIAASAAQRFGNSDVATYSLYCLDGVGKVASADWIDAESDEEALKEAERLSGGRTCELWANKRLVARLG